MIQDIEDLLRKYGTNSNSFLSLYPGYQFFYLEDPKRGCIPYLKTRTAWIGLGEPLAAQADRIELMEAFATAAAQDDKSIVLLPIGKKFCDEAKSQGFKSFQIGSEPYFDLKKTTMSQEEFKAVSHSAHSLKNMRGFRVHEVSLAQLPAEKILELTEILAEWKATRKTGELGFVNRVEPFWLQHYKKYYVLEGDGKIWAFVSSIPIWPEKSWFFIDVIRREDAPVGSVEFLFLEAMSLLHQQGAAEVSLGVSPLARLDGPEGYRSSWLDHLAPVIFEHFQWFYNFRSLYQFKAKFPVSEWRPSYLVHNFSRTDSRLLRVLIDGFVPQGVWFAVYQVIVRRLAFSHLIRGMRISFPQDFIFRNRATSLGDLFKRVKGCLAIIFLWIVVYAALWESSARLAFTWQAIEAGSKVSLIFRSMVVPGFLHWNFGHLFLNTMFFVLVGFTAEFYLGTPIVLMAYFSGHLFSNLITGVFFHFLVKDLSLHFLTYALVDRDVGASLGVFACAGVWFYLMKFRRIFFLGFIVLVALGVTFTGEYLQANHLVAVFLGFGVARLFFGELVYD